MKTDKEWEARARELFKESLRDGWTRTDLEKVGLALQLGREMAAEAAAEQRSLDVNLAARAADARAEEIARLIEADREGWRGDAATIARSTITKPNPTDALHSKLCASREKVAPDEAAIRADEREKIVNQLNGEGSFGPASRVRAAGRPRAREQVLEEALRKLSDFWKHEPLRTVVSDALEYRP